MSTKFNYHTNVALTAGGTISRAAASELRDLLGIQFTHHMSAGQTRAKAAKYGWGVTFVSATTGLPISRTRKAPVKKAAKPASTGYVKAKIAAAKAAKTVEHATPKLDALMYVPRHLTSV